MNELTKEVLPEYIPTLEELEYIFPKLPPPEKVNATILHVPVEATIQEQVVQVNDYLTIERPRRTRVGKITFYKYQESKDDKPQIIWVYKGMVKYK